MYTVKDNILLIQEGNMITIAKTITAYSWKFQEDVDNSVNKLCSEQGFRIQTMSNLVESGEKSNFVQLSQTFILIKDE